MTCTFNQLGCRCDLKISLAGGVTVNSISTLPVIHRRFSNAEVSVFWSPGRETRLSLPDRCVPSWMFRIPSVYFVIVQRCGGGKWPSRSRPPNGLKGRLVLAIAEHRTCQLCVHGRVRQPPRKHTPSSHSTRGTYSALAFSFTAFYPSLIFIIQKGPKWTSGPNNPLDVQAPSSLHTRNQCWPSTLSCSSGHVYTF